MNEWMDRRTDRGNDRWTEGGGGGRGMEVQSH